MFYCAAEKNSGERKKTNCLWVKKIAHNVLQQPNASQEGTNSTKTHTHSHLETMALDIDSTLSLVANGKQ